MIWPFNKIKKKTAQARMYKGAISSRLNSDWITSGSSVDAEVKSSIKALRDRSRQLARDNDHVRAFIRELKINVVGGGIPFQSQVKLKGGRLNEPVNDQIELAWKNWTKKELCHTGGTLSFEDIERLVIESVAISGEVFIRLIPQRFGKSKISLALEVIESDCLDDNMNGQASNGNFIRMGVEKDAWNRPQAYHFKKHPGDLQFAGAPSTQKVERVPASEIIHLFLTERPNQTRGVPWLSSAINHLHQLAGYTEAVVVAARTGAATMGFIQSPEGELRGDGISGNDRLYEFEPGVFKYLAPGEQVTVPDMHRPNGDYEPFMRSMLRSMAASVGVSYEAVSSDFSQTNYSSTRQALLKERDHYKVMQQWLIANFHQPIFERWLDMAYLSGAVQLKDYPLSPEKYQAVRWLPRGWQWVDPKSDLESYKTAVRNGFMTVGEVIAQSGGDFDEVMLQRKREQDTIRALGLVFDSDPAIDMQTQAQKAGADPDAATEAKESQQESPQESSDGPEIP